MIRKFYLVILALFIAGCSVPEPVEVDVTGDWEWLGNKVLLTDDYSKLTGGWGNTERFLPDGTYQYIDSRGDGEPDVRTGTWRMEDGFLFINRKNTGEIKYRFVSYKDGVLIYQSLASSVHVYLKRK
ncbi:hypothetical protein ACFSJ3_10545 [Corallincola platygyrae]|uniref:Lipocalin-like domain-containing protein n=1 Tax=Corallincola platygyrae TaxID=1193278 RepID=A0ABW4XMT1_9GAMM